MKGFVDKSMSFVKYEALIDTLVSEGKTTGPNQSDKMVEYTRLNRQRMSRLARTIEVLDETTSAMKRVSRPMIWLVITEAWCGDAAQNIPVIEKVAGESNRVATRYILRDEYPELMDRFLSKGARSIPKLIALDAHTFDVLGTWGARPAVAQELFLKRKAEGVEKPLITEELQRWYNADRGKSLQEELRQLALEWSTDDSPVFSGGLLPAERAMSTSTTVR